MIYYQDNEITIRDLMQSDIQPIVEEETAQGGEPPLVSRFYFCMDCQFAARYQ